MTEQALTPVDFVEDTHLPPRYGLIEFFRRLREDQLSVLTPEIFARNMVCNRFLFLDNVFLNHPDYIEHVLLTNHRNYTKSLFLRRVLGPLLGDGLLISEGEFWRRQRRIAAPAFHHKRIAEFVAVMAASTASLLERWRGRSEAFDVAPEMMALTLDIIARTMFSADIRGEVETVRRLMDKSWRCGPACSTSSGSPNGCRGCSQESTAKPSPPSTRWWRGFFASGEPTASIVAISCPCCLPRAIPRPARA